MNKLTLLILSVISFNVLSADFPIYVSAKKDEEMVAKLFETTRRVNISTKFGMWKQDMLRHITLECANQTKVINVKKNMVLPNEVYSPVLKQ